MFANTHKEFSVFYSSRRVNNGAFATNYGMHFEVIYHSNSHAFFKSGMLLSAAAEGSAPDVISQLLYELWILLLYLLCKLLPPVLNSCK